MSDDTAMVAWLRDTIEGDKRAAEAVTSGPWRAGTQDHGRPSAGKWDIDIVYQYSDESGYIHTTDPVDAQHIARHAPADVIVDCESKLAIIDEHSPVHSCGVWECDENDPCPTLRLLAYAYRHREGWREEWRP